MIPIETKEQILNIAKIEDIIGQYVSLRKRGSNLIGLCPFHNEKTPSFTVTPHKGIFKCFGCGESGDVISFLMKYDQLSYTEALKYLAERYNIFYEEKQLSQEEKAEMSEREALFLVSSFASKYFKDYLWQSEEGRSIGLSYFKERGFSDSIIEEFGLGFCPKEGDKFSKFALSEGYSEKALIDSGLSLKSETHNNLWDRFKERVIFPIKNISGKVVGFGGRIMLAEKTAKLAKYVNSPESAIYNKSNILYGLYEAKKHIVDADTVYLVEGYTDVLSLYQAGIKNVAASSGTSLTQDQIRLISRFSKNITVLYDGDAAGIKASFRGIDMILEKGLNVRVVLLPDGHDPDSFARSHTHQEILDYLKENTKDFISFKTDFFLKEIGSDPIKKAELIENIVSSISLIPEDNHIYRLTYIQECSKLLNIDEESLINRLNKIRRDKFRKELRKEQDFSSAETIGNLAVNYQEEIEKISSLDKENQRLKSLEAEILKLLILYGEKEVKIELDDPENEGVSCIYSRVADFLVDSLKEEGFELQFPIHKKVFEIFQDSLNRDFLAMVAESTENQMNALYHNEDQEIKSGVIDITTEENKLSEKWQDKGIFVRTCYNDLETLSRCTRDSILNLREFYIEKEYKEILNKLGSDLNDEAKEELLKEKMAYDQVRIDDSKKLKKVIY